jgi:hypothetical protein
MPLPQSKLPSPMEFPDVIQPVTAANFPELWETFGINKARNSAEIQYERLSAQIAFVTGHEHAVDEGGYPYSREEWKRYLHKCLNHLNKELRLGMAPQMIDVLTLCYTALQESPRYGGDPVIEARKGENTAVHSLHTFLQALRIYQKAIESKPELSQNIDFFRSFQSTCLMMAVHDLGEIFGEAGSLAQVANAGDFAVKDKSAYERMAFNFGVRLAVQTVIDKAGSEKEFFDKIDLIKAATNIQNQGVNKTDQQLVSEVSHLLTGEIPLSRRAAKLFGFLQDHWDWVEHPKASRNPFLGYLAATCERVQGTRHLNRMVKGANSPVALEDGRIEMVPTHSLMPGYRMLINGDYTEGHLGFMAEAIEPESPHEDILARQSTAWVYEAMRDLIKAGPVAFFTDPSVREYKLHDDGSAFSPPEVKKRLDEIDIARKLAMLEGEEITRQSALQDAFSQSALPIGKMAMTREQTVALYQRAIDRFFLPGIIDTATGKKRSETLIRDRPSALTDCAGAGNLTYSAKTMKTAAALKARII